jgi:inner membrane protein
MSLINFGKSNQSVSFKLIVIGVLILIFIPVSVMVQALISERADRQSETVQEVSDKWGAEQTIIGPVLTVPYATTGFAYFMPESLDVKGNIVSEIRSRGIYDVPLYTASLNFSGNFSNPDFASLGIHPNDMHWDKAFVSFQVPDFKGITDKITLTWDDKESEMSTGKNNKLFTSELGTNVGLDPAVPKEHSFSFDLNLRGSNTLNFLPVGKVTTVNLSSDWPYPSFDGNFLPLEHNITDSGFTAKWSILELNRTFPQSWTNANYISIGENDDFGVNLFMPVDVYQKTTRSAKYAIAVIALVFLVVFLVEVISKRRIHPMQYLLIGIALIIFYTLLLSLAEQISFANAYLISSIAIILMVTGFSKSVMKSSKLALSSGAVLALLYGFVYALLQMQDFALLFGSVGLFVILAAVMYVTRNVDWYKNE